MKKLGKHYKRRLLFRAWKARRRKPLDIHGNGARANARAEFQRLRATLPNVTICVDDRYAKFDPPDRLSFTENYELTLTFILALRQFFSQKSGYRCQNGNRRSFYADFSKLKTIDPAAGLVLAAELDRWSTSRRGKPTTYDDLWDSDVRGFFDEAGLFDLLGINMKSISTRNEATSGKRILSFQSGNWSDGKSADRLRERLEMLCGRPIGRRDIVYGAICEGMTNVLHHAYPRKMPLWPSNGLRRWWASGAWTPETRSVSVQLYDQGVGIPRTLPMSRHWKSGVLPLLPFFGSRTDASMIAAAMKYSQTSTGQPGRGKGFSQMADWIDRTGAGFLRVTSGKGSVRHAPDRPLRTETLPAPFCGTLVEWEVKIDD